MKLKFVTTIFVALGICVGTTTYAQYPNISKPSSNSMSLVTSIQSSVNYPAGQANISIPFYTLRYHDITVPVGISYNASGIRIEDRAGDVGMGWRLSAGGKITRIVKQRPDELNKMHWGKSPDNMIRTFFQSVDGKYKNHNQPDSEPDLFYFEIPGKSGMFVLDPTGKPYTIPYQNIKIQWVNGSYFTITDEQGAVYKFGVNSTARENTTTTFKNDNIKNGEQETISYVSTWHLESITDYKGNVVNFKYVTGVTQEVSSFTYTTTYSTSHSYNTPTSDWKLDDKTAKVTTITETKSIWEITGGRERILFAKYNSDASKWGNTIGHIHYYVDGNHIKTFAFGYDKFAHDRIFMRNIKERRPSSLERSVCIFEYYKTLQLPAYNSKDYDSWGYWNGAGNTNDTPKGNASHWVGILNYMSNPPRFANRDRSLNHTKACVLTAINNNVGGKTEYVYGLNGPSGGLRIEEIKHYETPGATPLVTRYEYLNEYGGSSAYIFKSPSHSKRPSGFSTGVSNYLRDPIVLSSRPFDDVYDVTGTSVVYGRISEIAPDGSKTIYDYTSPGDGAAYRNEAGKTYRYWDGVATPLVEPLSQNVIRPWEKAPETSRFWRQNLLKRVQKVDEKGNVIRNTEYQYKLDAPNKKVISGYVPYAVPFSIFNSSGTFYFLFQYIWESQPVYLEKEINHATNYSPRSETTYVYNTNLMAPTTITTTDAEGNQMKKVVRYPSEYSQGADTPLGKLAALSIPAPVETITYKNNKVVGAEFTEYGNFTIRNNKIVTLPQRRYYLPLGAPITDYRRSTFYESILVLDTRHKLAESYTYNSNGDVNNTYSPEGHNTYYVYQKESSGRDSDNAIAEISVPVNSTTAPEIRIDSLGIVLNREPAFLLPFFFYVTGTQTVSLTLSFGNARYIELDCRQLNNNTGRVTVSEPVMMEYPDVVTYSFTLDEGLYSILFRHLSIPLDETLPMTCDLNIRYPGGDLTPIPSYGVFHTSFEGPGEGGIASATAKTGSNVRNGTYTISLADFTPGEYVLTYWKRTNASTPWEKVTENMTVSSSTANKIIGGSFYIDEVRLVPKGSFVKTFTFKPQVGKTSETDTNGDTRYWQYDSWGRLYRVLNNDRNVVEQYEYNIKN